MINYKDLQKAVQGMTGMSEYWRKNVNLVPDVTKLMLGPSVDFSAATKSVQNMIDMQDAIRNATANMFVPQLKDIFPTLQTGVLFDSLPRINYAQFALPPNFGELLERMRERIQRGEDGRAVLADMNEPWLTALFDATEFADFLNLEEEERRLAIDEKLAQVFAEEDFKTDLQSLVESSELTRPRWRIINRAIDAHLAGDYLCSVPLLLPQLEGMFADLLHIKNLVVRQNGKVYEIDPATGQPRLNVKGKQIAVPGLQRLVELSQFPTTPGLVDFAGFVIDHTCGFRNGTLHGSDLAYDTVQNSNRTALQLAVIGLEINALAQSVALQEDEQQ
jgi:hypothetical protein